MTCDGRSKPNEIVKKTQNIIGNRNDCIASTLSSATKKKEAKRRREEKLKGKYALNTKTGSEKKGKRAESKLIKED